MDEDDMVCNAEVTMQEMVTETMESVEVVDFNRCERGSVNPKTPVLEADLSYIMQNAIIDTEKDIKGPESKLVESSGSDESSSDDDDDDDDDDVRITLVKDKSSKSSCTAAEVVIVSSSSDEDCEIMIKGKNDSKCILVQERKPLDQVLKEQSIGGNIESEENIVNNLLSDLVRKTVKLSREDNLTGDGISSADSSESEAGVEDLRKITERENQVIDNVPRVPNEVLPEELDIEVEEVFLTPKDHLNQIGVISGVVEKMVVVKSNNEAPALDCESAFFFEDRSYLGKVFDTFGPVKLPYYTINVVKDVDKSKLSVGTKICFVPFNEDLTKYVFLAQLKRLKGSDASWRNDCEPPENCIDYSDDEEERAAKREKKKKNSELVAKVTDNQKNVAQRNKPFNRNQNYSVDVQNTHQQNHKKGNNKFWQNKRSLPNSTNSEARNTFTQSSAPLFNNQSDSFHNNANINHSVSAQVVTSSLPPPVRPNTHPPAWPGVPPQPPSFSGVNVQVLSGTQPIRPGVQPILNNTPGAIGNRLKSPNMDLHSLLRPLLRPQSAPVQQGGFTSIRVPNQNILPGNGTIQASFPPQPMLGNDSLQSQQVFNQLNNLMNVRIPVPQQIQTQNGGQVFHNGPANNMSHNSMLPPSNVGQNYKQPPLQESFGNNYSDQIYPPNKFQNLDNFPPANGSNIQGNSQVFHDNPNFSSQGRTGSSNNSQSGIVKLNGFTFKI